MILKPLYLIGFSIARAQTISQTAWEFCQSYFRVYNSKSQYYFFFLYNQRYINLLCAKGGARIELTMKYNERIRELREDHSYTQQNIASILNVGQRTYSDYESGKTRIPIDSILILARYYDVSVDYITGASNVKRCYPND